MPPACHCNDGQESGSNYQPCPGCHECMQSPASPDPDFMEISMICNKTKQLVSVQNDPSTFVLMGERDYLMSRCSHSVDRGSYYFETIIETLEENAHVRIGWSTFFADFNLGLGSDEFGYGWRSNCGYAFHKSRGILFTDNVFSIGDTIGCFIRFPENSQTDTNSTTLPPSKDVNEKNNNKHENAAIKEENRPDSAENSPSSSKDSDEKNNIELENTAIEEENIPDTVENCSIDYFVNGQFCGTLWNVKNGFYSPAVSTYNCARVRINLGPNFDYVAGPDNTMCRKIPERDSPESPPPQ